MGTVEFAIINFSEMLERDNLAVIAIVETIDRTKKRRICYAVANRRDDSRDKSGAQRELTRSTCEFAPILDTTDVCLSQLARRQPTMRSFFTAG